MVVTVIAYGSGTDLRELRQVVDELSREFLKRIVGRGRPGCGTQQEQRDANCRAERVHAAACLGFPGPDCDFPSVPFHARRVR
jgi:hypothetical protein